MFMNLATQAGTLRQCHVMGPERNLRAKEGNEECPRGAHGCHATLPPVFIQAAASRAK